MFDYLIGSHLIYSHLYVFHGYLLLPSLSALAVLTKSSLAEARLFGSFCSPDLMRSSVKELQSCGTSLTGGGSCAICQHVNKQYFVSVW